MKIYIRTAEGRKMVIPLPMWLLKMGNGRWLTKFISSSIEQTVDLNNEDTEKVQEKMKSMEDIDLKQIIMCLELLKEYDGLTIVDVQSSDGTYVKIVA